MIKFYLLILCIFIGIVFADYHNHTHSNGKPPDKINWFILTPLIIIVSIIIILVLIAVGVLLYKNYCRYNVWQYPEYL